MHAESGPFKEQSGLQRIDESYLRSGEYSVPIVERILPDKPKIFLIPGWCETVDPEDPALSTFNDLGYSVIQFGTPFRERGKKKIYSSHTAQILDDANVFTDVINRLTNQKESVTLTGSSLGGLSALEVASAIPDKVDNLVLINPAIRHPFDNVLLLTGRYAGNIGIDNLQRFKKLGVKGTLGTVKTIGELVAHPIDAAHRGIGVIHSQESTYKAYQLAKRGILTTIITGNGDGIFHHDKTEQTFRKDFVDEFKKEQDPDIIFDHYLEHILMPRFVKIDGGHDLGLTGEAFAELVVRQQQITEYLRRTDPVYPLEK